MSRAEEPLPADLDGLAARLRDERPSLDALALDHVAQGVRRRAGAPQRRRRSSLAVALCLCFGIVLSTAGTGMAISGLSASGVTASGAQYGSVSAQGDTTTTPTLGGYTSTPPAASVKGQSTTTPTQQPTVAAAQDTQQLSATQGNATLPFTGFAALPVIGLGLALLAAGLVVRRRQRLGSAE
jgi:hypothetical protein